MRLHWSRQDAITLQTGQLVLIPGRVHDPHGHSVVPTHHGHGGVQDGDGDHPVVVSPQPHLLCLVQLPRELVT